MVTQNCPSCGRLVYMLGGTCEHCGYNESPGPHRLGPKEIYPYEVNNSLDHLLVLWRAMRHAAARIKVRPA